jgi:hypothetical protein
VQAAEEAAATEVVELAAVELGVVELGVVELAAVELVADTVADMADTAMVGTATGARLRATGTARAEPETAAGMASETAVVTEEVTAVATVDSGPV